MKVILIYPNFFPLCLPFKGTPKLFFIAMKSGTLLCQKEQEKEKNIPKPSKHGQM